MGEEISYSFKDFLKFVEQFQETPASARKKLVLRVKYKS